MSNINVIEGGGTPNVLLLRRRMAMSKKPTPQDTDPEYFIVEYDVPEAGTIKQAHAAGYTHEWGIWVDGVWQSASSNYVFPSAGRYTMRFKDERSNVQRLFDLCPNVVKVSIPQAFSVISYYMFRNTIMDEIILPSTLQSITDAFSGYNPSGVRLSMTCYAINPPAITVMPANVDHIYVPASSVNTYRTAEKWSSKASIIEAIP